MGRYLKTLLGVLFWAVLIGWTAQLMTANRGEGPSTYAALKKHLLQESIELDVEFPRNVLLEVGDAVLLDGGSRERIGEVCALLSTEGKVLPDALRWVKGARVRLFDRHWPGVREDASVRFVKVPEFAATWVFETLVTEEKARKVAAIWNNGFLSHRDRLLAKLAPVLRGVISDCEKVIEAEARPFLKRHRAEVDRLLAKVENELSHEKMTRLFEEEIWPDLHGNLNPLLDEIGREIWAKFPLWGLTWRVVYQSLPLTDNDHFRRRWDNFVQNEVVPILKSHSGDVIQISRKVAKNTLTNSRVGPVLRDAIVHLVSDPAFYRLSQAFLEEVFLDNPRFHEIMLARWRSRDVQHFVRFVSERLEETVRKIGDLLLGTREAGITKEFARVLRAQILEKDARRILIAPGSSELPLLEAGSKRVATIEEEDAR